MSGSQPKQPNWSLIGDLRKGTQGAVTPPPTSSSFVLQAPHPVELFDLKHHAGMRRVSYTGSQGNSGSRNSRLLLGSLASGDIITMWADLAKFGFPVEKETRWFVVLGVLNFPDLPDACVVLPLSTFNNEGKTAPNVKGWPSEFYKPVTKGDRDLKPIVPLCPNQSVITKGHRVAKGELLELATAFIVAPDTNGYIPAKKDGHLLKESMDDVWRSFMHLSDQHEEFRYLIRTSIRHWNLQEAIDTMYPLLWADAYDCEVAECQYGKIVRSHYKVEDWIKISAKARELLYTRYPNATVNDEEFFTGMRSITIKECRDALINEGKL